LARRLLSISVSEWKEDKAMNKKILVPLGRYDRSEEMIPYVEKVARRGMQVIFLMHYPVDGFIWAKEEYGMRAALKAKEMATYYSWEGSVERAKNQIAPACEALRVKGIEAAVDVYAGSLKKALRSHTLNGDVHLIMTRAGIGQRIAGFLSGSNSILGLFKRPPQSPVFLTHPSAVP
jgi:hypothetical protein